MKMPMSAKFALLAAAYAYNALVQGQQPDSSTIRPRVAEEIGQAATVAKVASNSLLVKAFIDAAANQTAAFEGVYSSVPKEVRIARLARYLSAKEPGTSNPIPSSGSVPDVDDFHWGYLARDINYVSARLETPKGAKLLRVDSPGGPYVFSAKGERIESGMSIVLPATDVTATFELGERKAVWTGNPTSGPVKVVFASTGRGCEIVVRSNPSEAIVYFNGKEYHERTNTSSVRDVGTWDVIVRRQGYKDWREQRTLGARESWTIEAKLTKQ